VSGESGDRNTGKGQERTKPRAEVEQQRRTSETIRSGDFARGGIKGALVEIGHTDPSSALTWSGRF